MNFRDQAPWLVLFFAFIFVVFVLPTVVVNKAFQYAMRTRNARLARMLLPWVKGLTPAKSKRMIAEKDRVFDALAEMTAADADGHEGRYDAARDRLLALDGKIPALQPWIHVSLAWCFVGLEQGHLAEQHAKAALALRLGGPNRRAPEHTLAVARLMQGQVAEALAVLEAEAKLPSVGPRADAARWYWLGEARRRAAKGDAREMYRRCIETDPDGEYRKRAELRLAEAAPYR